MKRGTQKSTRRTNHHEELPDDILNQLKKQKKLISQLKKELKESQETLTRVSASHRDGPVVRSTPETIMILDSAGAITFANRPWLCQSKVNLLGKALLELLPVADRARVRRSIRAAIAGVTESCDIQLPDLKDEPWFNLQFAPVHSNGKRTKAHETVCLWIRDISKQKRAELELQRTTEMLRRLTARSEEIRESERARIAREIHDELGQALTVLKMDLTWLQNQWTSTSPAVEKRARSMDESLDSLLSIVRRITSEIRPPLLDLGLIPAIEWQFEQFQQRSGIRTCVRIQPTEIELNKRAATAVFRVIQEALTNVARHAGANKVDFSMDLCDGELQLSIGDNGRGITRKEVESLSSFGLTGMRERIHHIGGLLEIGQMTTGGTRVSVRLPIERLSDQSEERKNV